jgi:thiol-disulfide isomerase/thioredoxin
MRTLFLLSLLFLQNGVLFSQQADYKPFEIEGSIDVDTGYIYLKIYDHAEYYPDDIRDFKAKINNRTFSFKGEIPYPQGFTLSYGDNYWSKLFVIDTGYQTVKCYLDSVRKLPEINNRIMEESRVDLAEAFKEVREKRALNNQKWKIASEKYNGDIPSDIKLSIEKEFKSLYVKSDSTLLQYVSTHPDSFLALWTLIELLDFGYEPIFDSIFEQFSGDLRSTHAGQALDRNLKIARVLAPGKRFPAISVKDNLERELDFTAYADRKYILLDFWYSYCGPCIAQFPHLKTIYSSYKDKGFEIIGISTDKSKLKDKWLKAIEKYQIQWPQFWDMDGIESSKLFINVFPTTILLDSNGTIIAKHIKPAELEQFLKENLK